MNDPSKIGVPIDTLNEADFTQIHDLCYANKYALDQFALLLKRKAADQEVIDRTNQFVPGGLTGGDVRLNWGFIWGAYRELGAFPVRYITLHTVTSFLPYFVYGGLYPVGLYDNNQGRFSYAPLYPHEFSAIINTAVKENTNLGGGEWKESAEIGASLLYLNSMLWRNRLFSKDNDTRFPSLYLDDVKYLTKFEIDLSPIIMSNVTKNENKAVVYGYTATYIDTAKREAIGIPPAYLLTKRRVVLQANENQLFLPVTRFRYLSDNFGYVWAIDLRYATQEGPLTAYSITHEIGKVAKSETANCIEGATGLAGFFNVNNEEFKGFQVAPGLARDKDLLRAFDNSVLTSFETYWNSPTFQGKESVCDDTSRNLNIIVGGAALTNGYWLPQIYPYLNF